MIRAAAAAAYSAGTVGLCAAACSTAPAPAITSSVPVVQIRAESARLIRGCRSSSGRTAVECRVSAGNRNTLRV